MASSILIAAGSRETEDPSMKHRQSFAPLRQSVFMALLVLATGCGGGGGSSPTESNASPLAIDVTLMSPDGSSTIVRCSLHLDGALLGNFSSGTPTGSARMDTTAHAAPGNHLLGAQIDEQTPSPTTYRLQGTAVFRGRTIQISEEKALATGERIEVSLPL